MGEKLEFLTIEVRKGQSEWIKLLLDAYGIPYTDWQQILKDRGYVNALHDKTGTPEI